MATRAKFLEARAEPMIGIHHHLAVTYVVVLETPPPRQISHLRRCARYDWTEPPTVEEEEDLRAAADAAAARPH